MKSVAVFLLVLLVVLACGCTTTGPSESATPTPHPDPGVQAYTTPHAIPSLIGNWSGPARGYTEGIGYRESGSVHMFMSVTEQNDRFFSGTMMLPLKNGSYMTERFAGVISHDGETLRIMEYDTHEHDDGWILSENEIELIFMYDEEPQSLYIDSLKRVR